MFSESLTQNLTVPWHQNRTVLNHTVLKVLSYAESVLLKALPKVRYVLQEPGLQVDGLVDGVHL